MSEVFLVRPAIGGWKNGAGHANVFSDIYKAMTYWHDCKSDYYEPCVRAITLDSPGTQRNVNKKERDDALKHLGLL